MGKNIIGPDLFNIYINDFPDVTGDKTKVYMYIDVCKLCLKYKNITETFELQNNLDRVYSWAKDKQLKLATKKSAYITLGHCKVPEHPYNLGIQILERIHSTRDVGVIIDEKLNCQGLKKSPQIQPKCGFAACVVSPAVCPA